ncbi:MAG: 7-cyano-7-deazaguanine synthase, partial [Planctomycetales bacterium]|nr:7-cyano-7-deazaguanine synthase [Planctomycetales bacterium]
ARQSVAVLCSGGVDSAVLLSLLQRRASRVVPLYVRCGLIWEGPEEAALRRILAWLNRRGDAPPLAPLVVLESPAAEIYGAHWSVTGQGTPDADSPDEAVYLPGRNLMLLTPASVWCVTNQVGFLALGSLCANPFADADERFMRCFERLIEQALGQAPTVLQPFAALAKADVVRLGADLPLEETFSCIAPIGDQRCGNCNKCAERRRAFAATSRGAAMPV